jgi:hypothetical protein
MMSLVLQLAFEPLGDGSCGKQNQTSTCCLGPDQQDTSG